MTSEKAFFHYLRKNSQSLYHIAKENKKEKKILAQAITEKDKNTITQILENTVSKKESKTYSKGDCIDEVLDYAIDKYDHLRDIRTVVHFEDLASNLINEKEYHMAEQLH